MFKVIHFSLPILLVIYVTKALGNSISLNSWIICIIFILSSKWFLFFQGGKSLEEQKKQFDELGALPLSTNPFFVKNIANSDEVNFEGMLYDIFS